MGTLNINECAMMSEENYLHALLQPEELELYLERIRKIFDASCDADTRSCLRVYAIKRFFVAGIPLRAAGKAGANDTQGGQNQKQQLPLRTVCFE